MITTLILIILVSAIVLFFAQEFISMFKWIFAFKGVPLVLPLLAASWAVFAFPDEFLIVIYYTRLTLSKAILVLTALMPFQQGAQTTALILFLILGSILPVLVLNLIWQKKSFHAYQYPFVTSAFLWVVLALFLLIPNAQYLY